MNGRKLLDLFVIIAIVLIAVGITSLSILQDRLDDEALSLLEQENHRLKKEVVSVGEKCKVPIRRLYKGIASYYSNEGCIGCREDRIMANGEIFDERGYTIAFNELPLNTWVMVENVETGDYTYARVTDTGGFDEIGRIADLSLAVRDAIGCTDLCLVTIVRVD